MTDSLKKRTGNAIFWSFIDKGGQQLLQLTFGVVLARILSPDEAGVFAMLIIFTVLANILQESGFSSAIIRKKEPDKTDYASVFYFNIAISIAAYIILFISAPLISWFYENPILTTLAQFTFLSFVFNAFGIIQNIILVRRMDFKTNTKITLIASSISGIVALALAYKGYGVWALAAQLTIQSFLRSLLLWLFVKWKPEANFSMQHIKHMMPYSSKLLATSLMNQFCSKLYTNIIGKAFSVHQAGIYNYADKFSTIPQSVISDGIKTAAFPALTKIQDDLEYTKKAYRKIMRTTAFVSFPAALLIIVIAKPVIVILLGEKWAESIPILQILAIGGAFYPLFSLITTLLQTIGKSGLIFKIEFYRNILALFILIFSFQFGVYGIVTGISCVTFIAFFAGNYVAGKNIHYKFFEIVKDTAPYGLIAFFCYMPFFFLPHLDISNLWLLLFIPSIAGSLIYLGILKASGSVILDDSIDFLKNLIKQ